MFYFAYLFLLLSVTIGIVGQLLLKQGMLRHQGFRLENVMLLFYDPFVLGGFTCYGGSVLLYFKVLESLDLSVAYPTVSLGYMAVTILSRPLFGEQISRARWTAVAIICVGVALVGLT
jgi:multidrug transporter EmrE-like cation transporter